MWFLPAAPKSRLKLAEGPVFHTGLPVVVDAILAVDPPDWLETSIKPRIESDNKTDGEIKPRMGAVPMAEVLMHYNLGHPLRHIKCPFPDHPDHRPSFRVTGETWICNCAPGGGTTGGGTDKLIYRIEGGLIKAHEFLQSQSEQVSKKVWTIHNRMFKFFRQELYSIRRPREKS